MKAWELGRQSELLDDIIAGRKTVEWRLYRGKFDGYSVGDTVDLSRDYRDSSGILYDGESRDTRVKIIAITIRRRSKINMEFWLSRLFMSLARNKSG